MGLSRLCPLYRALRRALFSVSLANQLVASIALPPGLKDPNQAPQNAGRDIVEIGAVEQDHDRVVAATRRVEHRYREAEPRAGVAPPAINLAHAQAVSVILGAIRGRSS